MKEKRLYASFEDPTPELSLFFSISSKSLLPFCSLAQPSIFLLLPLPLFLKGIALQVWYITTSIRPRFKASSIPVFSSILSAFSSSWTPFLPSLYLFSFNFFHENLLQLLSLFSSLRGKPSFLKLLQHFFLSLSFLFLFFLLFFFFLSLSSSFFLSRNSWSFGKFLKQVSFSLFLISSLCKSRISWEFTFVCCERRPQILSRPSAYN